MSHPGVLRRLRIRTFTIPEGPCEFRYRQAVPAAFAFQHTPVTGSEPPDDRIEKAPACPVRRACGDAIRVLEVEMLLPGDDAPILRDVGARLRELVATFPA